MVTDLEIRNAIITLKDMMPPEGQQYAVLPNGMSVPTFTNDVKNKRERAALQLAIEALELYKHELSDGTRT